LIIKSFAGKNLNGYINVAADFLPDLTFLYGINGCGKTTVVRSIHALLTLNYPVLGETQYSSLELKLEQDGKRVTIRASGTDQAIVISVTGSRERLAISRFVPDPDLPVWSVDDARRDWYTAQANMASGHSVVKIIEALPSPMYLGLERRTVGPVRRVVRPAARESRQSVFSNSLQASLNEASNHAARAFRNAYVAESKLKDELKDDLVLMTFKYDADAPSSGFLLIPKKDEIQRSLAAHEKIIEALSRIGLTGTSIESSVRGFFEHLSAIMADLPAPTRGKGPPELAAKDINRLLRYQFNKLLFDRATEMLKRIEKFSSDVRATFASIESYRELMNDFLKSSKKVMIVDLSGLSVSIEGVGQRPVNALSSGEQQLIVLFSQLWFNPSVQQSNVLMIDEPEVSLHIEWQEMFVDALLRAGPKLQLILATHSPSIILDRDDKAIELKPEYA
jgi:energy-coupling factor transporter ATP-binding protein EcfA2